MKKKNNKNPKRIDHDEKKTAEDVQKKKHISDIFLGNLQEAFSEFDKISEEERISLYGDRQYLDQFWEYFKNEYPDLLDTINKNDLPACIKEIESKGFSLKSLQENASKLDETFKPEDTEIHVMQESIQQFKNLCEQPSNAIVSSAFREFASFAGFDPITFEISEKGILKTITDLLPAWKKFVEKQHIKVGRTVSSEIEKVLFPQFNPTERIMVTTAITKIRKTLPNKLKTAFDTHFPLPVTIFSPYQDLLGFRGEWGQFLIDHAAEIDKPLAKKLDAIIVTNGDIQDGLLKFRKNFSRFSDFQQQERYFSRLFNGFVTRRLFDEVHATQKTVDNYITAMSQTFKEFPPYVNEIFKRYPFNDTKVLISDPAFHADIGAINAEISSLQQEYQESSDPVKKETIRKKISSLKEASELRRRQAYIAFLRTKDVQLADIFSALVQGHFDFSLLSSDQQQYIIDVLWKHKFIDIIKHKVPELISVTEEELMDFAESLFDLKTMDITLPTRYGPIPLHFLDKAFMSTSYRELPSIQNLENIKNLPLNFLAQLTAVNEKYFEESPIFDSLYYDFVSKEGPLRINDAYKVKITKDGNTVEGYLSAYCPIDEYNTDQNLDGKELFLYSSPLTSPDQERTCVTWKDESGAPTNIPVVIKDNEQAQYTVQVLDKRLNLNGQAIGSLLFGYALGQESKEISMAPAREKALGEKIGKLDVYKDKQEKFENIEDQQPETSFEKTSEKSKESSEQEKFMSERKQLAGYMFPEEQYKKNNGFVEGSRIFIPFTESEVPPPGEGKAWFQLEIKKINEKKGTFTTKFHGGELKLGTYEGQEKELPLSPDSLALIKSLFGDTLYKFPDLKGKSFDEQFQILSSSKAVEGFEGSFSDIAYGSGKFSFVSGNEKGKDVEYFGWYEPKIGEDPEAEAGKWTLYKVKSNPNHTFTLTGTFVDKDGKEVTYTRDMDYPTFMIFIREKRLQPKSEEQGNVIKQRQDLKNQETPTTVRGFSISNILGFFKNSFSKVKDGIKKYDEERTDDFTDILTKQGRMYSNIGKFLSPFARASAGFETLGMDYFMARDSKIRKKVEKRKKFYEDADFSLLYNDRIGPLIKGEITVKPHYKAAAMLLAMINKGKGPYNRNPDFAAKGMRVNILMGPDHQARYLEMRQKLIRELQQGAEKNGSIRADNKKNEILELEMKYIVHVMDGRQLGIQDGDKTKYYFYGKYSKQFIDELEGSYTKFFSQSTVDEGVGKMKSASFDFARAEFFRLLGDRPQQAIPCLKVMAMKATSPAQRRTFEAAVMAGMLSGIFLTMTMSDTQGMIKDICRTRGFVPGIRVKDIYQQTKLQRLLDIFSNRGFSKDTKYDASTFSFDDISGGTKNFVKWDDKSPGIFQSWISSGNTLNSLSDFFALKGKNADGKTLFDIYADPKTSLADKTLIKEFFGNSNDKDESLDREVKNNPYAVTGSLLTKSQSTVHQMLRIDQGGFVAQTGDERQTIRGFFTDMANSIPRGKVGSKEEVKYLVAKFFNRFGERGLSGTDVTMFIKRLKRCQMNQGKKDVENILYYSIVGQVLDHIGTGTLPEELLNALSTRKDFFKYNLEDILNSDVLVDSFGGLSYKRDFDVAKPQLMPWESCVSLLDRDLKQTLFFGRTQDEKNALNATYRNLKSNKEYINIPLYELAERLDRKFVIPNRFKMSANIDTEKLRAQTNLKQTLSSRPTGAKITNWETLENMRKILEGKPPIEEKIQDDEEYIPEYEDMDLY